MYDYMYCLYVRFDYTYIDICAFARGAGGGQLSINSKGSFNMHHPTDRITHTTAFDTPVVEHWLERGIAQWVHPMKDRSDDPSHHERTLYL